MTDLRGFIMPSFIQGFKLAHDRKIALRPLLILMLACSLITMAVGVYMNVKLGYEQGGLSLDTWYSGPASRIPADSTASLIKGVKDASTWKFGLDRRRHRADLRHDVGAFALRLVSPSPHRSADFADLPDLQYLVLGVSGLDVQSADFSVRRDGFVSQRRAALLGLALGDVMMMLFWLVIDGWQGKSGHKLMPG